MPKMNWDALAEKPEGRCPKCDSKIYPVEGTNVIRCVLYGEEGAFGCDFEITVAKKAELVGKILSRDFFRKNQNPEENLAALNNLGREEKEDNQEEDEDY